METVVYLLSPLVADWMARAGWPGPTAHDRQVVAAYQHYLFRHERPTLDQALVVHQALDRAGQRAARDRFALDRIVGPLNRRGLYQTLLTEWLPDINTNPDPTLRGEALGQTGKQYLHIGDYATALRYLEQSLKIRQAIGDVAGLCATLFNMGHIYRQNEQPDDAMAAWVTVYRLARPRGLAQALAALERLAGQLGLSGGLDAWEMLAQRGEGE